VLPATIRRLHNAAREGAGSVTVWGSGTPKREFLYVDDLAAACLVLLERYDGDAPINVGTGEDLTIRDLVRLVADVVGYAGELAYDTAKPDGTPRKVLDVSRIQALGWQAETPLRTGIQRTVEWYERTVAPVGEANGTR
jgi:GDP-L-fucose synthase